jgi:hypothetical protein
LKPIILSQGEEPEGKAALDFAKILSRWITMDDPSAERARKAADRRYE